jgi:rubrerythrin
MKTKVAENGKRLKPHDGITEWSVCGKCGNSIDWASDTLTAGRDEDDMSCPSCGHEDTAYLYADDDPSPTE